MAKAPAGPKTLQEAIRYFSDHETCQSFLVALRWPNGVQCPTCNSPSVVYLANQRRWKCRTKHPKQQFSIKVGTIFEDSPLGLDKWLPVVWLITNAKNGISSYEIARVLAVTQKTAWFMLHRIRVAMKAGGFVKIAGRVEADGTFIGPNPRKMHADKRAERGIVRGQDEHYISKAVIAGLLERSERKHASRVTAYVVPDTKSRSLMPPIERIVEPGSELITDMNRSYSFPHDLIHRVIDKTKAYVEGHVHTNGLENFWALLKRSLRGTYVAVEHFHLDAYVDEQVFRFNHRSKERGDGGRFVEVLRGIVGRRVTYAELTGQSPA